MKPWSIPKIWKGGECWIIGGGPSMPRQLGVPEDVIQRVQEGIEGIGAYSPYLLPILQNRHVIGVNIACMLGGEIVSLVYFGDRSFFERYKKQIKEYRGIKVTSVYLTQMRNAQYHNDIRHVKRDGKNVGISTNPNLICWNKSSGGACIGLAAQLGAKRINLLGFDMDTDSGKSHWHRAYKHITKESTFKKFMWPLDAVARDAKKLGVEVLNVNPKSAIDVFKKVELKDIL